MMKAARYHPEDGNQDTTKVQVDRVPIPDITEDEVLVRMGSASLCHSDLMLIDGTFPGSSKPVILGHEGVGTIETAGSNVRDFKAGDRVGFLPNKGSCFTCRGCQIHNLSCENGKPTLQGFSIDGFFAEYASVDSRCCIILPEKLDLKTSASFFCAGVTAFNGVSSSECQPGDWIAIIGCGGLGQMGIQYGKALGLKVIGIDINDACLNAAKEAGADLIYNSRTHRNYIEELKVATAGGAAAAVVFSNATAAYDGAPATLRIDGVLMVIGLPDKPFQVSAMDLMVGKYRIKAETTGPPWKLPKAVRFIAEHDIQARVELFELEDINIMIDRMRAGDAVKRMTVVF